MSVRLRDVAGKQFWLRYPGEMTAEDRVSLNRPGFKLYVNGYGVSDAWYGNEGPSKITTYQVIRVEADGPEHARRQVVEALGREPDDLRVDEGEST